MFPSGWTAQPPALQQSQAAQTPTGQWGQPLASTAAVGLLEPLAGSTGTAVAVAPFAGSSGGVASWMVPTAPAAAPPVDPWANVAVPSLEDKAAIAREKNRIAQRRWAGGSTSRAGGCVLHRGPGAPRGHFTPHPTPCHHPSPHSTTTTTRRPRPHTRLPRRFREKERRRLEEVQQAADALAADIAAVKAEKDQLELEHTLMQKTLAVGAARAPPAHACACWAALGQGRGAGHRMRWAAPFGARGGGLERAEATRRPAHPHPPPLPGPQRNAGAGQDAGAWR